MTEMTDFFKLNNKLTD